MANKPSSVCKNLSPRSMIPMVVAVDNILNRNFKPYLKLPLKPCRKLKTQRIRQDNSVLCYQKYSAMIVSGCPVHAPINVGYGPDGLFSNN